ncbi:uncharacterized protein LOC133297778 [Gastrolobium bilobum]|uniref:uncharacterized protein LOC133297778 n=1 Tax=Gastrolobium bilobum TaxID=150636 RepID=UPI002AB0E930|nr:uncharacterized protein LOC133297778 [Gastrolobium bilobum]
MARAEAYEHMKEEYKVHVHLKKVTKALHKAKARIEGCEKEQYAKLRDYLGELLRSNPGSTCQMQVIPQPDPQAPPIFSKLYICFDACKRGFKAGYRPLIGLDGCFLKGYYGGQLLSAVGEDANKSFYVIAYAVVDSETKENWKWFLTLFTRRHWQPLSVWVEFYFRSTEEVDSSTLRGDWKDKAIRGIVWECSRCNIVPQFQKSMTRLKGMNEEAWKYLDNIDPSSWVKAYFSHWPKCDNITNNMEEIWNVKIVGYRSKPIITLLEELRCYIMRRMAAHQRVLGTIRGKIPPAQQKKLDQRKVLRNSWTPTWTGNLQEDMYEVSGRGERVGVNLTTHTCACNAWQLIGLPCEHAITAICHKNEPPENYVHQWLKVDALHAIYAHTLNLVNSDKQIGRPKKHRKKDPTEEQGSSTKKVKRTYAAKYPKCGQTGHYAKSSKGPPTSNKGNRQARPESVKIGSSSVDEISLSQGGPAALGSSQPHEGNLRGSNPPPSNPQQANEMLSEETMNTTTSGTRSRFLAFMTTPCFRPPRSASRK